MLDTLPKEISNKECCIVNLDISRHPGTHWTSFVKNQSNILYFDSYGNLPPPRQLVQYFYSKGYINIYYNYNNFQKLNTYNCGHLCLNFLYNNQIS